MAIIPRGGKLSRRPDLIESKGKALYSFLQCLSLKMEQSSREISTSTPSQRVWLGRGVLSRDRAGHAVTLGSRDHHNNARKLSVKFNAS